MSSNESIKKGDKVIHVQAWPDGDPREVIAAVDGDLWLRFRERGGRVRNFIDAASDWRKVQPRWQVGKRYRRADDPADAPETVTAVDEDGATLVWYSNTVGDRHYFGRKSEARRGYVEVPDDE